MEQLSPTIEKIRERIAVHLAATPLDAVPNVCWRCLDTGYLRAFHDTKPVMIACLCTRRAAARGQLAVVPPIFGKPKLSRLRPRTDLHPAQARAIAHIKAHPDDSYLLIGRNGSGKSHIAWALYRHAISKRRPAVACRVRDLIADFRIIEMGDNGRDVLKTPRLTVVEMERARKRNLIILDEFEKARPSEFAAEMLFNVLDAARSFNHQLVVASNFTYEQLGEHWGRIDPVWGNSIMTRLQDCMVVKFF